ncbi:S5A_REDUCTASE domain-containing protein [Durusdinium trenchii]|uniref:S5A_REDUCTASE domain-containing protein n=1 Tax=Durusdinium trenchii TaxID=1381693 RepID=A0ABP0QGC8_9DINO
MSALSHVALADVAIQFACFSVAAALQTEKFYDISASLTYILCVLISRRQGVRNTRSAVNSGLVTLWALRLGSFLLWRVLQDGGDSRFAKAKTRPMVFLVFWAIQALWIFITALPVYLSNTKRTVSSTEERLEEGTASEVRNTPIGWRDMVGWSLWSLGFVVQATADLQKRLFQADPRNQGHWINVGLWRLAQHPNYFGEICMWWGIFLSCSASLRGWELLCVFSPCFVTFLLLRVSGVPILRKTGLKRWGHLREYQEYIKKTPLLVPLPRPEGHFLGRT